MKAQLTNEQEQLQDTAEKFIESNGGMEYARRRMNGEEGVIDDLWDEITNLGYTGITVPAEYGGIGEGMVHLAALLEIVGKYALPGPLPETAAVVAPLLDELGTEPQKEEYLEAIAGGEVTTSFAFYDDRTVALPESVQLVAESNGDTVRLDGTKTLVPYGGEVDTVVVAARTRQGTGFDGISLYLVDTDDSAVEANQLRSLDRTRPMYELDIDGLELDTERARLGPRNGAGTALSHAMDQYTIATTAMLVGAAERAIDLSVQYGKEREQYGQPIGRFQAVKHRIAEMWVDMQSARSLVYYAAWATAHDQPDASHATSAVKTFTADRMKRIFSDDMKNHGGMGFTWDHDGHIYLKLAKAWRNFVHSPEMHADRMIQARLSDD